MMIAEKVLLTKSPSSVLIATRELTSFPKSTLNEDVAIDYPAVGQVMLRRSMPIAVSMNLMMT